MSHSPISRSIVLIGLLTLVHCTNGVKSTHRLRDSSIRNSQTDPTGKTQTDKTIIIDGEKGPVERMPLMIYVRPFSRGELIRVSGYWLPYMGKKEYRLAEGVFPVEMRHQGKWRPIVVRLGTQGASPSPLSGLEEKVKRLIRYVALSNWSQSISTSLNKLRLQTICLKLELEDLDKSVILPLLPDVPCIIADENVFNLSLVRKSLRRNRRLKILVVESGGSTATLDAHLLKQHRMLYYLDVQWLKIKNSDSLSSLAALRVFRAQMTGGYSTKFIGSLPSLVAVSATSMKINSLPISQKNKSLKYIDVRDNEIRNVDVLANAKNLQYLVISNNPISRLDVQRLPQALRFIDASWTKVNRLPRYKAGSLRKVILYGSPIEKKEVIGFRRFNKSADVMYHWKDTLVRAAKKSKALIVRWTRKKRHNLGSDFEISNTLKGAKSILGFVNKLQGTFRNAECACPGNPHLIFLNGKKEVMVVQVHHNRSISWDFLQGSVFLTNEASEFVKAITPSGTKTHRARPSLGKGNAM